MYQGILTSVSGRIGTITLNRPEVGNAFAKESYGEVRDAAERFEADPAVGAIVVTGAGKHFSAGGDIKRFKMLIEAEEYLDGNKIHAAGEMSNTLRRCKKPVIAMINGTATGAGLSLALACDFRVVTPASRLIMGFIKLGLPGDTGAIYLLSKLIGIEKASLMMMTGDPVDGARAVELGLATILAPEGGLEEAAYGLAEKLAAMSAGAIARQKELLFKYSYSDFDAYRKDEAAFMQDASREPDFTEAVYAFLEKRPPKFNRQK